MQISKKGEKALCQRWTFRCIYHMSLSSSVIPLGLGLILFCFGREWGWGVLNHTHVAPAGRIKMHTPRKAIIPATNCLKIIFFSLTVAPIFNQFRSLSAVCSCRGFHNTNQLVDCVVIFTPYFESPFPLVTKSNMITRCVLNLTPSMTGDKSTCIAF